MAKLSLWLPPFSPDYSGASAVLFDLSTVTAMHDASGCTGNYTGYDEPRWYGSKSGIYCSGLRQIDAVMGNDEALIKKMEAAAKDIKPELMALVGSPVPMVIGADLKGIAAELEERTGIPSIGLDTTGLAYYDKGAFWAARALMERFAEPKAKQKKRVNILGALPMDFGFGEDISHVKAMLEAEGYEIGLCLAMGYCLEDIRTAATAEVNLAVSRFGYLVARYMEKRFGIPYLCGFPAGAAGKKRWLSELEETRKSGKSRNVCAVYRKETVPNALIIGEQVAANAIRVGLADDFGWETAVVGCLYGMEQELALPQDLDLPDENAILTAVNDPQYTVIIADPFMKALLKGKSPKRFLSFSQYAVSSMLGAEERAEIAGEKFNEWYKEKKT